MNEHNAKQVKTEARKHFSSLWKISLHGEVCKSWFTVLKFNLKVVLLFELQIVCCDGNLRESAFVSVQCNNKQIIFGNLLKFQIYLHMSIWTISYDIRTWSTLRVCTSMHVTVLLTNLLTFNLYKSS